MNVWINEISNVFTIPPECALTLLIYFRWNKEKLLETYPMDPKKIAKEAGIQHLGVSSPTREAFTCEICLDDREAGSGFCLGCRHVFCKNCWSVTLLFSLLATHTSCD